MTLYRSGMGIAGVLTFTAIPVTAFAAAHAMDAQSVIEGVKAAYAELFDTPQQIDHRFYTTTRQLNNPDIQTIGTMTVLQNGEYMRGEIDVDSVVALSEGDDHRPLDNPGLTIVVQRLT